MPSSTQTFRVFVSSTFSDFVAEREALRQHVFPKLTDLCRTYGATFQAVDLRWGVSREAGQDQQTMRICLGEIERCHAATKRPNFIVFLGDRYGWRPVPEEIPADEFERIGEHLVAAEINENGLKLEGTWWYRRDNNAVPLAYRLMPRTGEHKDYRRWRKAERMLFVALREAATKSGFMPEQLRRYTASATEQEIAQRGLLDRDRADGSPFCFFRRIVGLPKLASGRAEEFRDFDDHGRPDEIAHAQLQDLKEQLRGCVGADFVHEYTAKWRESGSTTDHIDRLCEDVHSCLSAVIRSELETRVEVEPLDEEISAHKEFADDRIRFFVGREQRLGTIKDYLQKPAGHPLVIHGDPGTGKSTLLAKALIDSGAGQSDAIVFRFVGTVPGSANIRTLLEGLCWQLRRRYGGDGTVLPTDYSDLVGVFRKQIEKASEERPLVLFLDALDQLSDAHGGRSLTWLPTDLPEHVHIVVSTLPGECLDVLKSNVSDTYRHELAPMPRTEAGILLDRWLSDAGRRLQDAQREKVLAAFEQSGGTPLYLRFAFEEARLWHSDSSRVRLAPSVSGLIRQLFKRLSKPANHGKSLVSRSLAYIACGKNGLSWEEVLGVLSNDATIMKPLWDDEHFPIEKGDPLPTVLWSRLYTDLKPYLTERRADGASTLDFFHRQLRDVIEKDYLSNRNKKQRHRKLALFFRALPDKEDGPVDKEPSRRELSEWPYQLAHGEMCRELDRALMDYTFLQAKVSAFGPQPVIEDFDRPLAPPLSAKMEKAIGATRHLELLKGAIRLSIPTLTRDPKQLPAHLVGRLMQFDVKSLRSLCQRAAEHRSRFPWLCPRSRSLEPPGGPLLQTLNWTGWDIRLSADGSLAATVAWDTEVHNPVINIWHVYDGSRLRTIPLSSGLPGRGAVVFDSNARRVAAPVGEDSIKAFDVASGAELWQLREPNPITITNPDRVAAMSPTWEHCAHWCGTVFDVTKQAPAFKFRRSDEGSRVKLLTFTPNGRFLLVADDIMLEIWSIADRSRIASQAIWGCDGLAISSDSRRVLALSGLPPQYDLTEWSIPDAELLAEHFRDLHLGAIRGMALLPDERRLVFAVYRGAIATWDCDSPEQVRVLAETDRTLDGLAIDASSERAFTCSSNGKTYVWDLSARHWSSDAARRPAMGYPVVITPDGKTLLTRQGGALLAYDTESRTVIGRHTLPADTGDIHVVPGRHALAAIAGSGVYVVDLQSMQSTLVDGRSSASLERTGILAASSDGRIVLRSWQSVSLEPDRTEWASGVDVIDIDRAKPIRTLRDDLDSSVRPYSSYTLMLIRPGTSEVFTKADWGTDIYVWSFEDGQRKGALPPHDFTTHCMVFETEGMRALLGTDRGLWLYDAMNRTLSPTSCQDDIRVIVIDPTGRYLAVQRGRTTVTLLRRGDFTPIARYDADGEVRSMIFSPDGRQLFVGDRLETLHFLRVVE